MGLVLDLAMLALALVVCASLALLAWTLAVTGRGSIRRERAAVAERRARLGLAERRLTEAAEQIDATLRRGVAMTRRQGDA